MIYTIPEKFVFKYYSKKYKEEESVKGEGNVSFRDMLQKAELFEQLPEEQTKETLIPMKHKRFENCVVNDIIEEKLGILEDVEYITAPLHNAKYWKQYKPYRCQDGVEVDAKIATSKTLHNITEVIGSLDYGVGGLPK